MSTEPPPPYDPAHPPVYSKEQMVAAQAAIAKLSEGDEARLKLKNDINKVTKDAIEIDTKFRTIGEKLFKIDFEDKSGLNEKFYPSWAGFRERWRTILSQSQTTAMQIAAYADQFNKVILPFSVDIGPAVLTKDQKIQMLKNFKEQANDFRTQAIDTDKAFESLSTDVGNFSQTFGSFSKTKKEDDDKEILQLNNEITGLKSKISILDGVITGLAISIGLTAWGAATLALIPGFGVFCLIGGLLAIGAEIGVLTAQLNQRSDAYAEVAAKKKRIEELNNEINVINAALAGLAQAKEDIVGMQGCFATFHSIWEEIKKEIDEIISWLNSGQNQADTPVVLATFINHANSLYKSLGVALTLYAAGIDPSKLPKETAAQPDAKTAPTA